MPALSTSRSFLAIDVPGHGYSSQLPKGMFYNFLNGPLLIQLICEYFKWPKISLMGHSMGSIMSFAYTTYVPDNVDLLICIDGLHPLIFPNNTERTGKLIQKFVKYANISTMSNEPPCYTLEEMAKKLHEGTKKSIQVEYAKYILHRNTAPSKKNPGLYYFTIDPRLKAGPHFVGVPALYENDALRIKCPIFMCIPKGSPFFLHKEVYEDLLNVMKGKEHVDCHFVPGTHHVHLNEPENVQQLISKFLEKYHKLDDSPNSKIIEVESSS